MPAWAERRGRTAFSPSTTSPPLEGDRERLAHTLPGYLETPLVRQLLADRGMSVERLEAGWDALVDRLAGTGVVLRPGLPQPFGWGGAPLGWRARAAGAERPRIASLCVIVV